MVPNKLFIQLASEIGLPDPAQLERLDALQMEWARQGRPMSLFELAQAEGILDDDLARRFISAADERQAAAAPPTTKSGSGRTKSGSGRTKSGSGRTKSGSGRTKSGSGRTKSGSGRTKSGARTRSSSGARAKPKSDRTQPARAERRSPGDRRAGDRRKASHGTGQERRLGERRTGDRRTASRKPSSPLPLIAVGVGAIVLIGAAAVIALRPPPTPTEVADGGSPATKTDQVDPQEVQRLERLAASEADQVRRLAKSGQRDLALARLDAVLGRLRGRAAAANAIDELHTLRAELAAPPAEMPDPGPVVPRKTRTTPPPKTRKPPEAREDPGAEDPPTTAKKTPRSGKALPWENDDDDDDGDDDTVAKPPVVRRGPVPPPTPSKPTPSKPTPSKPAPSKPTTTAPPSGTPRAGGKTGGSGAGGLDPEYVARRDALERTDAKGFTALAKWARRKRLFEEEKEALNLALLADPNHTSARKLLTKLLTREKNHRDFRTPWRRDAKVIYVETNTSEALLHYYCDSVAAFYQRFSKIFNVRRNPLKAWGKKIGVKIFATREDFKRYQVETGTSPSESAVGYYSLKNKELVLYYDPNDPAETLDTLFHEGTHLFVHLAFGEQVQFLPIWLSEGIAEYFGPSRLDRKKKDLKFGSPSYGRLRHARALTRGGNAISLKGHLLRHTDYGSFGAARYALSWALVHMLIEKRKGKKHKYRNGFVRYFELVSKNRNPVEGFEEVFGPAARMEKEWLDYIKNFPLPVLEEGRALAREDKHAEAIPLFEQHCTKNPKDPIGPFLLGESLYELRKYDDAAAAYRRAIALNRNYADAYLGLALSLNLGGKEAECVAPAKQAVAISPTAANYIVLATCALEAKDKATGQAAIAQAISLAGPSRWLLDIKRQLDAL